MVAYEIAILKEPVRIWYAAQLFFNYSKGHTSSTCIGIESGEVIVGNHFGRVVRDSGM